jgi:hypothetical protein
MYVRKSTCGYPLFELWISKIGRVHIHKSNCGYLRLEFWISIAEMELWISTIRTVDIRPFELWISTMPIVDTHNCSGIVDIHKSHCGYQQLELLISTIAFVDICKSD